MSFGTGFLRHSMMEPFRENLDGYPVLLRFLTEALPEKMAHLKLQNGTLWRWNRPIVGENADGVPHLRIEHRVMASGPTVTDMLANTAFYLGLIHYLARLPEPPEHRLSFAETRENFYEAARLGLGARVHWFGGRRDLQALILNELIPAAREGLSATAMDKEEISYYLEEVLQERIVKGQNGAAWQRHFVDRYGRDFQALSQSYLEHQNTGVPVHRWTI